jgi:hypothetical protein
MSISYKFTADWSFYKTAFARYRRQRPNRHQGLLMLSLIALVVAGAWLYARATCAFWVNIPEFTLIGGIIGGCVGLVVGKIILPARIKRLPGFGSEATVVLNEEGLIVNWPSFTRVVRLPDGSITASWWNYH